VTQPPPGLTDLQRRLADFAAARHWQPYHTPKNLAIALSVEASELLEIFQWLTPREAAAVMADEDTAYRVRDEVADVLAYLLQFCQVLGIDVLDALAAKIDRNELRFPLPGGGPGPGTAGGPEAGARPAGDTGGRSGPRADGARDQGGAHSSG
jgi:NTP pyrophosphatase (non-canonical NTP hydrolase)